VFGYILGAGAYAEFVYGRIWGHEKKPTANNRGGISLVSVPNLTPPESYTLPPPIFLHRLYPSLLTEHPISAKTRGIIDSQVRFASLPTCSAETATTWQPATVRLGVYIS